MKRTLESISVTFEFSDGHNISAVIDPESAEWQQWGQGSDLLGENVDRLTAMARAAAEHSQVIDEEDDEDDDEA